MDSDKPGPHTGATSKLRPPVFQYPSPENKSSQESSSFSLFSRVKEFSASTTDYLTGANSKVDPEAVKMATGKSHSEEIAKAIGVIKNAEKTSKTDTPVSDVLLNQLKYSRDVKNYSHAVAK